MDVHEASDGGAVDVADRGEVDHHLPRSPLHELAHLGEEGRQHGVGELGLPDPHHANVALLVDHELHDLTSARLFARALAFAPAAAPAAAAASAPRGPG